jgi:hypothetical protein
VEVDILFVLHPAFLVRFPQSLPFGSLMSTKLEYADSIEGEMESRRARRSCLNADLILVAI